MTKFMKFELISFLVLKVFGYFCGFAGALAIIGFAGSLEHNLITVTQFCLYELHAWCLIALSFGAYYLREIIKEDFIRRDTYLRRKKH